MAAPLSNISNGHGNDRRNVANTLTGLKRWSCQSKELPPVAQIKALHIYDFDNTLFKTPLPNPKLWNPHSFSRLQNQYIFTSGGWWHDQRILEATGNGTEVEEPRAWSGWWNEEIAELIRLSAEQNDALTVLLTGRGERNFSDIIERMVGSKKLHLDMICLKPEVGPKNQRFSSTMHYKQAFLQELAYTYSEADEIKVYEDRPKQTKGFREFFAKLNRLNFPDTNRKHLEANVIQVATDQIHNLDPLVEAAAVQQLINDHNANLPPKTRPLELKRTVFFTGYLISPADTAKLLGLVKIPSNLIESEIKYLANSILIVPRPADAGILAKVGGMGHKQMWQVTGFSFYQGTIWAVRVSPVPPNSGVHTINHIPSLVLATYKNTRPEAANNIQNWQSVPLDKQYILQTEVGEKIQLRIETEYDENEYNSLLDQRNLKRRHSPIQGSTRNGFYHEDHKRPLTNHANGRVANQNRVKAGGSVVGGIRTGTGQSNGRSGRTNGPGQSGGRSARQKGQRGAYKSLDDMTLGDPRPQRGEPNYDDYNPNGAGYENVFPAMKGAGAENTGGLPYGT